MSNKLITDLQLISNLTDDCNFPTDNGVQSFRATLAQMRTKFLSGGAPLEVLSEGVYKSLKVMMDAIYPPLPKITGSATFSNATNNINMTDIGKMHGLEVGDVVLISGSSHAKNNSYFTVEVITDDNNIVVNYEHKGGVSGKSLTDDTGKSGVGVELFCKWFNAPVGLGQAELLVIKGSSYGGAYFSNLADDVILTNNRNRPIVLKLGGATNHVTQAGMKYKKNGLELKYGWLTANNGTVTSFITDIVQPLDEFSVVVANNSGYRSTHGFLSLIC